MKKTISRLMAFIALTLLSPMLTFAQPPGEGWVKLGDYIKGVYNYDKKDHCYTLPLEKQDFLPIEKIAYKKINGKNQDKSYICIGGRPTFKNGNISNKFSNWVYVYSNFKIQEGNGNSAKVLNPKDLNTDNEGWTIYSLISMQPAFITNINDVKKGPDSNIWDNIYVLPGKDNYKELAEINQKEKQEKEKEDGKWIPLDTYMKLPQYKYAGQHFYDGSYKKNIKDLFPISGIAYKIGKKPNDFEIGIKAISDIAHDGSVSLSRGMTITDATLNKFVSDDNGFNILDLNDTYVITSVDSRMGRPFDKIYVRLGKKYNPEIKRQENLQKFLDKQKQNFPTYIKSLIPNNSEIIEITDNIVKFENGDFIINSSSFFNEHNGYLNIDFKNMQVTLSDGTIYKGLIDSQNAYQTKVITEVILPDKSIYKGSLIGNDLFDNLNSLSKYGKKSFIEGTLTFANGKEHRYSRGEDIDEPADTMTPEKKALIKKYGEDNVFSAQMGIIKVGMPLELIRKFWSPTYDGGGSETDAYTLRTSWGAFGAGNHWYFRVSKKTGKVTSVTKLN